MNHLAHELFRLRTESEIDASLRAEHVRHHGITAALHAFEHQSRPTFADHAAMDLCQLEVRINSALMVMISFSLLSRSRNVRRLGCILRLRPVRSLLDSSRARARRGRGFAEAFFDLVVRDLGGFGDVRLM